MFPNLGFYNTLPGLEDRRSPNAASIIALDEKHVPSTFPINIWAAQTARYMEYWRWFNGDILNEERARTKEGKKILKYPLGINPVRNFARKHAALLLGEETFDTPQPLVKSLCTPRNPLNGSLGFDDDERKLALLSQNIINAVWADSNGRALQTENATLSQFLGGSVFQVTWQPQRKKDVQIPIIVQNVMPDFFLPIWQSNDPWSLLEAFVVYRIPNYVAKELYGEPNSTAGWSTYCEHWTRNNYSIYLNGTPVTSNFYGPTETYLNKQNPFGFVPFVYIPHLREGNFYGSSMVEDLRGLTREFNARSADVADAIRDSVHRKRYVRDLNGDPKPKLLDEKGEVRAINLGSTNPATKAVPDVFTEDPPQLPESVAGFTNTLWGQLLREGQIGDIAFGEDEGSQRSALTLAFRMWPSTAHSRMERTYWTDGLNQLSRYILKICNVKSADLPGINIPDDFGARLQFAQDWKPMIPRDREQQVNEVILRFQAGLLSPEKGLVMLADIDYIPEEIERIREWLTFQAGLGATDVKGSQGGEGANTVLQEPKASSGMGLND